MPGARQLQRHLVQEDLIQHSLRDQGLLTQKMAAIGNCCLEEMLACDKWVTVESIKGPCSSLHLHLQRHSLLLLESDFDSVPPHLQPPRAGRAGQHPRHRQQQGSFQSLKKKKSQKLLPLLLGAHQNLMVRPYF